MLSSMESPSQPNLEGAPPGPPDAGPSRRLPAGPVVLAVLVALAALAGASLGYFMRLDPAEVRGLEDYTPPVMSRVLAADGTVIDTFAEQNRMLLDFNEIPVKFREALIAVEDSNFYEHPGVDLTGIARAAWLDVRRGRLAQGASTLTMQLARTLFLHRAKTWTRKIQEMLLALEIERNYSKDEILRFYVNQVYMGHGRYGLEAASRFYFGKGARDLDLSECALLAGIIQRPEALSPLREPDRAIRRRNHVLARMVAEGYVNPDQAKAAGAEPLELAAAHGSDDLAPYFVEDVRRWLKTRYGDSSIYREGLEIRTTLDRRLQRFANAAVEAGLRSLDKRQGWRGAAGHVPEGTDPESFRPSSWDRGLAEGAVVDGVVLRVDRERAEVRVGDHLGTLGTDEIAWTGRTRPSSILKPGDLVRVRLEKLESGGTVRIALEQEPAVEAALIAIDPRTGAVRAMVGGFDFERSEFNRATQARRQTGSTFKPFVYAAALAHGDTLADTIVDEPTVFLDPQTREPYQPENYSRTYYGRVTLRRALEKSVDIATVELLDEIGYRPVIELARRLGIRSELQPYPSLALGAFEVTLQELTGAYAAFANQGVAVEPHLVDEVLDREGTAIARIEPPIRDALSPQIAYLMNRCLAGVITDGTGRAAASLGRPLAGKTGTTDENTDAWFIGYAPDLAVGVWVGFDVKKSLGSRETGAAAALPIWQQFMENAYAGVPPEDFERPPDITIVPIDRETGLRANPAAHCADVLPEVFVSGTEPSTYCSVAAHERLRLPYTLQRYPLDERGELEIPSADLDALLQNDLSVFLSPDGSRLLASTPDGVVSMPFRRVPGAPTAAVAPELLEGLDTSDWVGRDGRRAKIVVLNR